MKSFQPDDRKITEQAAQWQQWLQNGGRREREGFTQWLLESRRHVRNYLLLTAFDRELSNIDPQRRHDVDALIAEAKANAIPLRGTALASPTPSRIHWRWIGTAAASIALLLTLWRWPWLQAETYTTAIGEQQTLKLEDGSVVYLNAQSNLTVEFSGQQRHVRLKDGEALFVVERDAKRPFTVAVGSTNVRVLGTQFHVRQSHEETVVSVLEGKVRVEQPSLVTGGVSADEVLSAGEEVSVASNGQLRRQTAADVTHRVAWRQRVLEFRDDSLAKVVAEFNRYNRAPRFTVQDEAIAARKYTGVFKADDPESLAQLLSQEGDLTLERSEGEILIRAR